MYSIDWQTVVTDDALAKLRSVAGSGDKPNDDTLRPAVAAILGHAGGLPVSDSDWSAADCTGACLRLLHDATGATLSRRYGFTTTLPGCDLGPAGAGLDRRLVATKRVAVNRAGEQALLPLPVLGPITATRAVESRRRGGPFAAPRDLAARVAGVNASGAERLSLVLEFSGRPTPPPYTGDFAQDFGLLLAQQPFDDAAARLAGAIEALAAVAAGNPHPFTRAGRRRRDLPAPVTALPDPAATQHIEILEDRDYFPRLKTLLGAAAKSIDVAMFFVSLTSPTHPSAELLGLLADAHDAGRAVRVLVDHDGDDDPYGSRVINAAAIAFLKDRGVPVRTDSAENLLHSKFVLIDERLAVLGSHNWTAGSYFRYHDTSVAIDSVEFAATLGERFHGLWDGGA